MIAVPTAKETNPEEANPASLWMSIDPEVINDYDNFNSIETEARLWRCCHHYSSSCDLGIYRRGFSQPGKSQGTGDRLRYPLGFAALLTLVMPYMLSRFQPESIFTFFAGMMVLQLFYVIRMMPETNGRTLEALSESLPK